MQLAVRLVHHVRFTIKDYTPEDILKMLPFDFEYRQWGRWTYRQSYAALGGLISVFFDGAQEGQGVCVDITGSGIEALEAKAQVDGGHFDMRQFVSEWVGRGARGSRFDYATDTTDESITLELVGDHLRSDSFSSRAQVWQPIARHYRAGRVELQGYSIGARQSESYMRIYDKALEQKKSGHHIRFEAEWKGKKAARAMEILAVEGWDALSGCLRSVIEFTELGAEDSNVTRRPVAAWWTSLIDAAKHVVDVGKASAGSLTKTYAWMQRQCKGAFWALTEASGGSFDWFHELVREGALKHSDRVRHMVDTSRLFLYGEGFEHVGAAVVG